ncbi:MAG: helix-turn-helix transcriptional regulator [Clostridia bacterium]|nr:helix-turn-helix transcriptional regulator [Clostridia bacterium]
MSISYKKLWKKLIDIDMTKTELRLRADLGTATLAKLGKDQHVSLDVLLRICKALNCNISEIMDVFPVGEDNE